MSTAERTYVAEFGEEGESQVRGLRPQEGDEKAGDGEARDVSQRVGCPCGAVGRHQVIGAHDARQEGDLGWPEEQAHGRDQEDQRVDVHDVSQGREGDEHNQRGTHQIAGDEHAFVLPAVNERAGDGPERNVGQRRSEEDEPGGQRRVGQRIHQHAERDLVEAVAEEADGLGQPERGETSIKCQADIGMAEDAGADRERRGGAGASRTAKHDGPLEADARVGHLACARTKGHAAQRILVTADEGGEGEPAQPGGNEGIADARDVVEQRNRNRQDVGERPSVQEEAAVEGVRQERVKREVQVGHAHPDGSQGRWPDGHPACVDDDGQAVRGGSDQDREQPRVAAVGPQAADQQSERAGVQRQPQGVRQLDPVGYGELGSEAHRQGEEDQPHPSEPNVDEADHPAAGEHSGNDAEQQPENDHALTVPSWIGAVCAVM